MKTILHITKYYYPYNGGIEAVTRQLVEGLTDYRNIVICFSSDRDTVSMGSRSIALAFRQLSLVRQSRYGTASICGD